MEIKRIRPKKTWRSEVVRRPIHGHGANNSFIYIATRNSIFQGSTCVCSATDQTVFEQGLECITFAPAADGFLCSREL